jgi:hypothetical protein
VYINRITGVLGVISRGKPDLNISGFYVFALDILMVHYGVFHLVLRRFAGREEKRCKGDHYANENGNWFWNHGWVGFLKTNP